MEQGTMDNFEYPVRLKEAAEGGFVVTFPDVPEAITQGEDKAEALARARDALETALEFYTDKGEKVPAPRKAKRGQHVVRPAALFCLKLAIYQAMRDEKVRKTELARRLNSHMMQVDRLLNLHHDSRMDQIEAALGALNRKMSVSVEVVHRA
jgi:antitoxin HicB